MCYNMENDKQKWPKIPTFDDYFEPSDLELENIKLKQELKIHKAIVEIVQDNKDEFLWEPCDCGCPSKSTARSKAAVEIIRLLWALEE